MKSIVLASILLPLSSFVAADAYKCEPGKGSVSYQQYSCPKSAEQSIVRIYGNSHRVDRNAQEEPNPQLAALIESQKAYELALRVREEKRVKKEQEKIEQDALAVVLEKQQKCEKYSALYHERVRLQAEAVVENASSDAPVQMTSEMVDSTRSTMDSYCGVAPRASFYRPTGSQLVIDLVSSR